MATLYANTRILVSVSSADNPIVRLKAESAERLAR
jgi:hypothetical protein